MGGRCRNCNNKIKRGINDTAKSIKYSDEYPHHGKIPSLSVKFWLTREKAIEVELGDEGWQGPTPPGRQNSDSSSLDIDIGPPTFPHEVKTTIEYIGPFHYQNPQVSSQLERLALENYSPKFKPKTGDSRLPYHAAISGGCLSILCATNDIRVLIRTRRNNEAISDEYTEANVRQNFRHIFMCLVNKHVGMVMAASRPSGDTRDHRHDSLAYATMAILHLEIWHFLLTIRNSGAFSDWLSSVEKELKARLVEGCGRFPTWRSVIHGSFKNLQRHSGPLIVYMHLRHTKGEEVEEEILPPSEPTKLPLRGSLTPQSQFRLSNWSSSDSGTSTPLTDLPVDEPFPIPFTSATGTVADGLIQTIPAPVDSVIAPHYFDSYHVSNDHNAYNAIPDPSLGNDMFSSDYGPPQQPNASIMASGLDGLDQFRFEDTIDDDFLLFNQSLYGAQ